MPSIQGDFFGLPVPTLQALQAVWVTAITRLAQGQAYTIDGRSLTRANLSEARNTLREINAALAAAAGQNGVSYAQFRTGYTR
jgi:hypothetical protein